MSILPHTTGSGSYCAKCLRLDWKHKRFLSGPSTHKRKQGEPCKIVYCSRYFPKANTTEGRREASTAVLSLALLATRLPCFVPTWRRDAPATLLMVNEKGVCCIVKVEILCQSCISWSGHHHSLPPSPEYVFLATIWGSGMCTSNKQRTSCLSSTTNTFQYR